MNKVLSKNKINSFCKKIFCEGKETFFEKNTSFQKIFLHDKAPFPKK